MTETSEEALWAIEETLWSGSIADFKARMAEGCVMVFMPPVGILSGEAVLETLRVAPRWTSVAMTQRRLARPSEAVAALAYEAEATRGESEPYRALCSSTYVLGPDGWRIAQHQQTRISRDGD